MVYWIPHFFMKYKPWKTMVNENHVFSGQPWLSYIMNLQDTGIRQCFLLDKSGRKMCTIFSAVLRRNRGKVTSWRLLGTPLAALSVIKQVHFALWTLAIKLSCYSWTTLLRSHFLKKFFNCAMQYNAAYSNNKPNCKIQLLMSHTRGQIIRKWKPNPPSLIVQFCCNASL
jgi:hypothetical protein